MKFSKLLPLCLSVIGFATTYTYAQQETRFEREFDRDETAVREFVESKENIDVKTKSNNLEISGDVRFVYQNKQEKATVLVTDKDFSDFDPNNFDSSELKEKYRRLRGGDYVNKDGLPISCNDFNVKFNLKVKYDFDHTWAMAQVQFNTLAGISTIEECKGQSFPVFNSSGDSVKRVMVDRRWGGKGSAGNVGITLKRAFIGQTIFADGKHRLDLEIGRRKLDDVFMSEIQFDNYFDGVLLDFASEIDEVSEWYWKIGAFVVDQRIDHYGWATEIGFLDIMGTDWDARYSFIDWQKRGVNRCFIMNPIGTRFQISQFTLSYSINPTLFDREIPIELYGAFLINSAAKKSVFSNDRKANLGWYIDIFAGNVLKKGDWSLEFIYAYVEAQAVPDFDIYGISRGNILNERLTDIVPNGPSNYSSSDFSEMSSSQSSSKPKYNSYFVRRGNANYQGILVDFVYGISDNFLIDIGYEYSMEANKHIGGPHRYQNIEMEFLYAF